MARKFLAAAFFSICGLLAAGPPVSAQDYPTRSVRMIVPYVAGSPVDVFARVLFQNVSTRLGQLIVIENRPGAGTTIGTRAAATADPDGYTLLLSGQGLAVVPYFYPKLDLDPVKNLVSIGSLAGWSHFMIVPNKMPVKSLAELVEHAKKNPGKLSFGFGLGTSPQILGEYFKTVAGVDILSVPYKGGENARQDLLAGQIDINFVPLSNVAPLLQQVRVLAVTGSTRDRQMPDVPSMAESGYPQIGFNPDTWLAAYAPAKTPDAIVRKLNEMFNASLNSAEVRATLDKLGMNPMPGTPEEADKFLIEQMKAWPPVLKAAKINPVQQ